MRARVYVCMCVYMCVCVCMYVCSRVCVCVYVCFIPELHVTVATVLFSRLDLSKETVPLPTAFVMSQQVTERDTLRRTTDQFMNKNMRQFGVAHEI